MATTCSAWLSIIEGLPEIHARLMRVQIEHQDWRIILKRYDRAQTLFYLDPPYVSETRRAGKYQHEMSEADYEDLVGRLLELKGMAILSGYAHAIYQPLEEAGWKREDWQTTCRAALLLGNGAALEKQRRVESAWISPSVKGQKKLMDLHE